MSRGLGNFNAFTMEQDEFFTCTSSPSVVTTTVTTTTAISTPCIFTQSQYSPRLPLPTRFGSTGNIADQNRSLSQNNVFTYSNEQINSNCEHPSWQVVKSTHKRKHPGKDSQNRIKFVKTSEIPTTNSNYFSPLAMESDQQETGAQSAAQVSNRKVDPKPPPVFIQGVTNYQLMISSILSVVKEDEYICRSLANNVVKINPKTIDSYRQLVRYLRSNNTSFHTYQAKQDRAYRVVIRHIHHSVPTDDIKEEIEKLGFKVRNVTNVLKRSTKDPLNLFFVDLEPADSNKKIFEVQYLMHMKISVEPPRKINSAAQCTRCQNYGHTKTYCTRPYSCVKCGGDHSSISCTKDRNTPATCALCQGSHPANYKGCTVYKDLQSFRMKQHPNQRQPNSGSQSFVDNNAPHSIPQRSTHHVSYASAARVNLDQPSTSQATQSTNFGTNLNTIPENTKVITLTSFLNEFKAMFNQMINQNSMIMTMLNTVINKLVQK